MKFGAILWKFDILSITAFNLSANLKILLHMCDTYSCDYLQHSSFRLNWFPFPILSFVE